MSHFVLKDTMKPEKTSLSSVLKDVQKITESMIKSKENDTRCVKRKHYKKPFTY